MIFGTHKVEGRGDHSAMIPTHKTAQARSSNRALQLRIIAMLPVVPLLGAQRPAGYSKSGFRDH
jgi:hypothetical protein